MGTKTSKIYRNFCPEVKFEIFGIFATNLSEYADELDRNMAYTELAKIKAGKDDWRWYWSSIAPQHYTDCSYYSVLVNRGKSVKKEVIMKELIPNQQKDYDKHMYNCKDKIYIPGTSSFYRSNEIIVNGIKIKIGDSLFLLLLRLAVELKKGEGGWVNIYSLYDEHIISDPDKYQIYSRLRTAIKGSLIDKDGEKFIENDGSKNYRISTHPDFISYNKEKLRNHQDSQIRKLAKKLP